jgi:hypothetical protein
LLKTKKNELENKFNKSGMDIDVRADMLKGIAGLNLGDPLYPFESAWCC